MLVKFASALNAPTVSIPAMFAESDVYLRYTGSSSARRRVADGAQRSLGVVRSGKFEQPQAAQARHACGCLTAGGCRRSTVADANNHSMTSRSASAPDTDICCQLPFSSSPSSALTTSTEARATSRQRMKKTSVGSQRSLPFVAMGFIAFI